MSSVKTIVLVCDLCGSEDQIDTHLMHVDGQAVEFEACPGCWAKTLEPIAILSKVGRKPAKSKKVSQKSNVMIYPGQKWRFTAHCLERMGTRHISPDAAVRAANDPELTRGGREPNLQIRTRGSVKVVVCEEKNLIVTVAKKDEEVDAVA